MEGVVIVIWDILRIIIILDLDAFSLFRYFVVMMYSMTLSKHLFIESINVSIVSI